MRRDPIVEEVRKHRAAIAREHGNDIDAIIAAFQQDDATGEIATVSFPPKRFVKSAPRKARKSGGPTRRASKGADVKKVNPAGQTTIDVANGPVQRTQPYPETIKMLESLGAVNNHKCVSC